MNTHDTTPEHVDAVVIGAGFAGLYMLHHLRDTYGLRVRVYDTAGGVGGTWYWNRYPGARCDTESYIYCYSFDRDLWQEWEWSGKYPRQPELLTYLEHVAQRYDLYRDIHLNTRVERATFDDAAGRWTVETDTGEVVSAQYFITGVGLLASVPHVPDVPGLDSFEGEWYHTGRWPHEPVDFSGKRVGIIGTGSTGTQAIPVIACEARETVVFQRTPQYAIPARHENFGPEDMARVKEDYDGLFAHVNWSVNGFPWGHNGRSALDDTPDERTAVFTRDWAEGGFKFLAGSYKDLLMDRRANDFASEFVRARIRETVHNPELAELLVPADHPLGSKRPIIDTNYYETYNRDDVTLVDIRHDPIGKVTPRGIRLASGIEHELDVLVLATGFDAVSGPFLKIDIRGRDGCELREVWEDGPRSFRGLAIAGFPNMLMITGPGSTFGNLPVSIQHHVEWIGRFIAHLAELGLDRFEVDEQTETEWMERITEESERTVLSLSSSWFTGDNIPGKPRSPGVYFGNFGHYRRECEELAMAGYPGFLPA